MSKANFLFGTASAAVLAVGLVAAPARAQITPDATLPNNSVVLPNGNILTIEGGTEAGVNLFHSFQDFSIPTGSEAFFNNVLTIDNIITRVTGGNLSDINGLIRANGGANLFLINPNGIQFGPNASLDIGGSFLGSTADSLLFEDGRSFSATQTDASPLLNINVPIGLQFGATAQPIVVRSQANAGTSVLEAAGGLQVPNGQTLALVGGNIEFIRGHITATDGRIELGSVAPESSIDLTPIDSGWTLGYESVSNFLDIRLVSGPPDPSLSQLAFIDVSGNGGGNIEIRGRHLSVAGLIFANVLGDAAGGDINIHLTESLEVTSGIIGAFTGAGGMEGVSGNGGNINISAKEVVVDAGTITTNSGSAGDAGDLTITTERLTIADASEVSSAAFGAGDGGNLTIQASESVEITGFAEEVQFASSVLVTVIPGSTGNGGNLTIETNFLRLAEGGEVSASTVGFGNGGNIRIRAADIEVSGISENDEFVSGIYAFSETDFPAGTIEIDANTVTVRDGGEISVSALGSSSAGNLNIEANSIFLDTNGRVSADLRSGTQGNITLDTADLRLRRGSSITTNASGDATGGNINIDTDTLVALENSDISANAEESFGGQVNIAADGIFGTQFREAPTPESDITATSALGAEFSGAVQIQTPDVDATSGLVALDGDTLNPDTQVRNACAAAVKNRFVLAGSGGLPEDPTQYLRGQTVWRDTRLGEIDTHLIPNAAETEFEETSTPIAPLVEATGWITNSRGQIELVVASGNPTHSSWQPHPECDSVSQNSSETESSAVGQPKSPSR